MNSQLTQSRLKELLHYNPDTGLFTWKVSLSKRVKVGDIAGTVKNPGYLRIRIDGKPYYAHRLAWLYVYGAWPKDQIDHINGERTDNRICNLREATNAENQQNRKKQINNVSGYPGVYWNKSGQKWQARIKINSKTKYLGLFETPEAGHHAYLAAKAELHKFQPIPRTEKKSVRRMSS